MRSSRTLVVVVLASAGGLASARGGAGADVKPAGAYPFVLPGLSAGPDARPKALLWCQGANLMGVVVPDERSHDCGTASQKRPTALLLRDGRCELNSGAVSFGFLVARKAWVFEGGGRVPAEQTGWLLHRFEGSLKEGQLRGVLVQVDISHPGYAFEKKNVDVEALPAEQVSFADEAAWRSGIAQTFCLAAGGP
jgi:hypothetical protein